MTKPKTQDFRLPFPTRAMIINGVEVEEYVIPKGKKDVVLRALYPFHPVPSLDEDRIDIHSGKSFKVREFRVTREGGRNFLVSPFYEEGGGTVIDWMPLEPDYVG